MYVGGYDSSFRGGVLPALGPQLVARDPVKPKSEDENDEEDEKNWNRAFHGNTKPSGGVTEFGSQKLAMFGST